jgi:hypothetical protein
VIYESSALYGYIEKNPLFGPSPLRDFALNPKNFGTLIFADFQRLVGE